MIRREWLSTYCQHSLGLNVASDKAIMATLTRFENAFSCPEDLEFFAQYLLPILKKYGIEDLPTANFYHGSGPSINLALYRHRTDINFYIFCCSVTFNYRHGQGFLTNRQVDMEVFLEKFESIARNFEIQRAVHSWTLSCEREPCGVRNLAGTLIARFGSDENPWSDRVANPWIMVRDISATLVHSILLYPALQIDRKCYDSHDLFMTDLHKLFCRLNFIQDSKK
jgi:hypothetical protein